MLLTVSEFRARVLGSDLEQLLNELSEETGRNNPNERKACASSFRQLAYAVASPALAPLHLYLGNAGNLALEYRLPASSSWCDLVLLGNNGKTPSAVILELKHWDTRHDRILPYPGLVERPSTGLTLHPSEQVKGYSEYCRHFHSAVHETAAVVRGCVVFTQFPVNPVYTGDPHKELTAQYPCHSAVGKSDISNVINFLNAVVVNPDADFAERFARGHYRQDRSFIRAIGETLRRSPHRRLELLDEQRKGFFVALAALKQAIEDNQRTGKKRVVIIEGPPGSGKSAIAARLWAEVAADANIEQGDLAFVSTSSSQNDVSEHLFSDGAGAVKKASSFSPATVRELTALNTKFPGQFENINSWRTNVATLRKLWGKFDPNDDSYLVSIVDEAHALINPEHADARGPYGFPLPFGPLGYHIIRASVVSVFLMDGKQGFRERETTTREDICKWAMELGAEVLPIVSLEERQFRCGGSVEYLEWVESLLVSANETALAENSRLWRNHPFSLAHDPALRVAETSVGTSLSARRRFTFEILYSPAELEAILRAHAEDGQSVRLVASYARKWVTEGAPNPHGLPPNMQDFQLSWRNASGEHQWSRIWNWRGAPQGYVSWIDPAPGVPMHSNPLAEVGCPFTVRGFDFDYLGVLWLNDVVWRGGRWVVLPDNVYETGLTRHAQRARAEPEADGTKHTALLRKILQGYRILLTRAVRGVYVWAEDPETMAHLAQCLD